MKFIASQDFEILETAGKWVFQNALNTIELRENTETEALKTSGNVIDATDRFRTETENTLKETKQEASENIGGAAVFDIRQHSRYQTNEVHGKASRLWISEAGVKSLNPAEWLSLIFRSKEPILKAIEMNIDVIVDMLDSPSLYSGLTRAFLKKTLKNAINAIRSGKENQLSVVALDILQNAVTFINGEITKDFKQFDEEVAPTLTGKGSEKIAIFIRNLTFHDRRVLGQQKTRVSQFADGVTDIHTRIGSARETRRKSFENIENMIQIEYNKAYQSGKTTIATGISDYFSYLIHNPEKYLSNPNNKVGGYNYKSFNCIDPVLFLDTVNHYHAEGIISMQRVQRLHNDTNDVISNFKGRINHLEVLKETGFDEMEKQLMMVSSEKKKFPEKEDHTTFLNERLRKELSAPPRNIKIEQDIFGKNIYLTPKEENWILINYLSKNLLIYQLLDPDTRGYVAEYFYKNHEEMNSTLVSGGLEEEASYVSRARALSVAEETLKSTQKALNLLPVLGEEMASEDSGRATVAIQTLESVGAAFQSFYKIMLAGGAKLDPNKSIEDLLAENEGALFHKLPKEEKETMKNVIFIDGLSSILTKERIQALKEKRADFEKTLLVPDEPFREGQSKFLKESQQTLKQIAIDNKGGVGEKGTGSVWSALSTRQGDDSKSDTDTETSSPDTDSPSTMSSGLQTSASDLRELIENLQTSFNGWESTIQGRKGIVFPVIPDVKDVEKVLVDGTLKSIETLRKTSGITASMANPERPTFDELMNLTLGAEVAKEMKPQMESFVYNNTIQTWEELSQNALDGTILQSLRIADVTRQTEITPTGLALNNNLIEGPIRLVPEKGDRNTLTYETDDFVYVISKPTIGGNANPSNILVYEKTEDEKGDLSEDKPFSMNFTHPPKKAVLLSASYKEPEITNNAYYKNLWAKGDMKKSYFANGTTDNYHQQKAA